MAEKIWPPSTAIKGRTPDLEEENTQLRTQLHDALFQVGYQTKEIANLRAELKAALDALRTAPEPPWNTRPNVGWQGAYCDWYEAQAALGGDA